VSPTGSIHDELTLPGSAALGAYFIQVKPGEQYISGEGFEVQEYKKPEYEVRVTPAKSHLIQGDSTQVTIDSRYYFGEPVAGAKVTYAFYRSPYWFPVWYEPDDDNSDQPIDSSDSD